ncbi:hypothetical protein [uncultured Phycicoccus sp.]|uniref:hypothetical protein n=1 Tax=uncultured Phycicoccus sp. TaxID=661422 RepID=UPI00260A995B|nr:hypothetical protein [uncultured Phycicoccus sp.]
MNLEWVVPLLTAVLGFLGGNGWSRLQLSGRLRADVAAEVEILNQMPAGRARDALAQHIDGRVLLLVAEQEGRTSTERQNVRWAVVFILLGLLLPVLAYVEPEFAASPWLPSAFRVMGVAMMAFGFFSLMRVREQHQQRKWAKRRAAETDVIAAQGSSSSQPD